MPGIPQTKSLEITNSINDLLQEGHYLHQDMIALLEIAGKVLRKHKLFFTQFSSSLTTDNQDAFPAITLSLGIQAPVEEIAEMNMALAELVSDELVSIPNGFHVYFSKATGEGSPLP